MNENSSSVFTELDDEGLDIEAIFGNSNAGSENPFEAPEPAQETTEEKQEAPAEQQATETPPPAPEKKTEKAKSEKKEIPDPISAAFENKTQENTQKGLYVRNAILSIRKEVGHLPNIKYSKYVWSPAYKGVDDYYHARAAA